MPGEFGGTSGHQPDFEPLSRLTDVLCELGCVEDAPSRVQFAGLLGGQLHNEAPAPAAAPSDLRFRPDRTSWPDTRTHGFAARPTLPRTADEHLAAGDAAAALVRYADVLADAPAEPYALAGWIVARTIL